MESQSARVADSEMAYMVYMPDVEMILAGSPDEDYVQWRLQSPRQRHLRVSSPSTIRRKVIYVKRCWSFAASSQHS